VTYLTLPFLADFTDVAILLLRLMVGLIFFTSGWAHVTKSVERSKSIEMSKGFTAFLGIVECAGALGLAFGVLTRWAALGLILVMLGAMQKKIVKWKTGFWGKSGADGWSYEVMMILMNFVIATTGGGRYVLESLFR
jgi:putative oxidoreductase